MSQHDVKAVIKHFNELLANYPPVERAEILENCDFCQICGHEHDSDHGCTMPDECEDGCCEVTTR